MDIHGWKPKPETEPETKPKPEPENRGRKTNTKPETRKTETCGYPHRTRSAAISNPNPNLELLPMTETGKPKTTKKLPSKLDWKTPSPSRRRPPKPQQHQYKNPLRISGMEGFNPTLPNTHLVDTGMYTAR